MERPYIEDKLFEKIDFSENALPIGEYENCRFVNCFFSNSSLSKISFAECEFIACDLSTAKLNKTCFRDIRFKSCKLLGLHFEDCDSFLFTVDFESCLINLSSFYKMKIKKLQFKNSSLQEVDFTEADASGALFDNCDLARAKFENTVLEKADFRTSFNYSINPELNKIKKAKFSLPGVIGLLDGYDIEIE